jgi:hypothetical protein
MMSMAMICRTAIQKREEVKSGMAKNVFQSLMLLNFQQTSGLSLAPL